MKAVADTGPLLAAADRRDEAHALAASLVGAFGRDLLIPAAVLVEVDQLLRSRVSVYSAHELLVSVAKGDYTIETGSLRLLREAIAIDRKFADLDLGLVDATVMAIAERDDLPVLTFDFADFRAASPTSGFWRLVVDEHRYRDAVGN